MDNRKFEKLIDLIINENEEKARELFHQIVVEKSREIYESIMDEEMMADDDMDEGMGGQVGQLMDEISAEESGVMEDDEDMEGEEEVEYDFSDDEDAGEEHDEAAEEDLADEVHDLEDRVVSIEDKLDDLLAQFEAEMGGEEEEEGAEEEEMGSEEEEEGEEEAAMMEAIQLQKVAVKHGDDGAYTKTPTAFNSGKAGMDSKPVNFSGGGQEKGRAAPTHKDVEGASSFANTPGKGSRDLGKAPAATKSQASGVNTKSPVAHK